VKERRWTLWVRDERGKRHRGFVSYGEDVPVEAPELPAEFRIALLARSARVPRAPSATAICVPKLAKGDAPVATTGNTELIAGLKKGELPALQRAQFAAGRVVLEIGTIDAHSVFPDARRHVDLEALALLLVEQAHAEAIAPYTAIIRHELRVARNADPLSALESRLSPADPADRPPARAPGVVRLRGALARLHAGAPPRADLETFIEDLRFLRLFERDAHPLPRAALDRLLADVVGSPATRKRTTRHKPATILPMRRSSTRRRTNT
jgi:hypothetical protein